MSRRTWLSQDGPHPLGQKIISSNGIYKMLYVVTLTLRPTMYRHKPVDQNRMCKIMLDKVFRKDEFKHQYKVSLVAELTKECNIHYHGIVDLADFKHKARLIDRFRQYNPTFGKKDISQLTDYPAWVEYINKAKDETRSIIGDPILYDDFAVLADKQFRPDSDEVDVRPKPQEEVQRRRRHVAPLPVGETGGPGEQGSTEQGSACTPASEGHSIEPENDSDIEELSPEMYLGIPDD